MNRNAVSTTISVALTAVCAATAAAQTAPDRTVLPIHEPQYPHSTVFDVRNATPPPRFEVKAPAGAPNVLIVLIDDMGFGQSSAFGGPINMPTAERLANNGLRYNHFHTTALSFADPGGSSFRAQSPHEQYRFDHGDLDDVPGKHRPAPRERGPAGDDAAVQRLRNRCIREEPRDRRVGSQPVRSDGSLADPQRF